MKILVLPSWYPPQGGEFFQYYCHYFAKTGMDVSVVVLEISTWKQLSIKSFLKSYKIQVKDENGLNVIRSGYIKIPKFEKLNAILWSRKMFQLGMYYLNNIEKSDLILVQSALWAGIPGMKLSKRFNIPYVISEHRGRFVMNNFFANETLKKWQSKMLVKVFSNCSIIIAVSTSLKNGIQRLALKNIPIEVIGNFVDTNMFSLHHETSMILSFKFLCIADLEYYKGLDVLLYAFERLSSKYGEFELAIGGDGSQLKDLQAICNRLKIQDKVKFLGKLTSLEVRKNLQDSHIFVLPSRFEAFGIVLIEAMSCGLPIISTKSGGPEDIVENENLGILVETNHVEQLAEAMERMYLNYSQYNPEFIRNHVTYKYQPEHIIQQYKNVFQGIISNKSIE